MSPKLWITIVVWLAPMRRWLEPVNGVASLNGAARDAITLMLKRADELGHTDPGHYLWRASQHHHYDPTTPAKKWDGA